MNIPLMIGLACLLYVIGFVLWASAQPENEPLPKPRVDRVIRDDDWSADSGRVRHP